jgi:predicted esterase
MTATALRQWLALLLVFASIGQAQAESSRDRDLRDLRNRIGGRVLDYTHHHGCDRRIYSTALCRKVDMYVYLPPGYSPRKAYPMLLWLHGAFGDESAFMSTAQIDDLDRLIRAGCMPPTVVVCPDGSYTGEDDLDAPHSLYVNGCGGKFEDMLTQDVIPFMRANFSLRTDREAMAAGGISAGGFGAAHLALKHPELIGHVLSISGGLNLRYDSTDGGYFGDFSPRTYRWQTVYQPNQVIAKYLIGILRFRQKRFIEPIFGCFPCMEAVIKRVNPTDLVFHVPATGQQWLISYGTRDNLNLDAQSESFAYFARRKGYDITIHRLEGGKHLPSDFSQQVRWAHAWLGKRLAGPIDIVDVTEPTDSEEIILEPAAVDPPPVP